MSKKIELDLYVVRNQDGQFLRSKGYGGSGSKWVDDITKARIYPKIGTARAQVTWFANSYPEYGVPQLVRLTCTGVEVLDETKRVKKTQVSKAKKELEYKRRHTETMKRQLKAEEARIRAKLEELG
jgi:hypothetical protein